jgi:ribosomal protein L14E/L6E/L27E
MRLQVGTVVCAIAGKEQNNFYLIVKTDENYVWLADGRHRTMQNPKRKNPKHVRPTQTRWDTDGMTDAGLRKKLRLFKEGNKFV